MPARCSAAQSTNRAGGAAGASLRRQQQEQGSGRSLRRSRPPRPALHGSARLGTALHGLARLGTARPGAAPWRSRGPVQRCCPGCRRPPAGPARAVHPRGPPRAPGPCEPRRPGGPARGAPSSARGERDEVSVTCTPHAPLCAGCAAPSSTPSLCN